jgi:predicted O-linked N-acetylglucosamine transferase (SPINDLY family)
MISDIDRALELHRAGRLEEAEVLYRRVLQVQPEHPDALHLLGVLTAQRGDCEAAVKLFQWAIQIRSQVADYHNSLGEALRALGKSDAAVIAYRQALTLNSNHREARYNLANALQGQGNLEAAIAAYRQVLTLAPDDAAAHNNLALALQAQGELGEALTHFQRARALDPQSAEICYNLGNALKADKQPAKAIGAYRHALALKPDYPEACNNLGIVLQLEGALAEAISAFQQAIALNPDYPEAYDNLGNALQMQDNQELAVACYRQAIALKPHYSAAYSNLGTALKTQDKLTEAIAAYRQSLALSPDVGDTHFNLGNALVAQGKLEEATASYRRALELSPEFADAYSNLLLALHYDANADPDVLQSEHRRWAKQHAPTPATVGQSHTNDPNPERRLRIGYVSPDFRAHSVAFFIEPILTHHDRQCFEVFCYANVSDGDGVTARLRNVADHWTDIVLMSDADVAAQIRRDQVDILVDLAGHTGGNRLCVFAEKPAPVQVTYLGYPNTTGLTAIDYRLTDALADPPGDTDSSCSETLVRLPEGFLCYQVPIDCPPTTSLPALTTGYVTFGSFNNVIKVNAAVVALWARILGALPQAQLLLKARALAYAEGRGRLQGLFEQHGVSPDRIEMIPWIKGHAEHQETYGRVDIALDPFPYNGTTTTCEALWMGVPVITLAGTTHAGRVGVSLLTHAGLPELIVASPEAYVALAVELANDLPRLQGLRESLRARLAASPLCDAEGFTRALEAAYRGMWLDWCRKKRTPVSESDVSGDARN